MNNLAELIPKTADIIDENGEEKRLSIDNLSVGSLFVVKPGEIIPADGVIVEGNSCIDESTLTGESIPADKTVGMLVFAATINQSGCIKCKATRVGDETTVSKIIQSVDFEDKNKSIYFKIMDRLFTTIVPISVTICRKLGEDNGIIFKDYSGIKKLGSTQIIAIDKTGTITKGEPEVTDVFSTASIEHSGYSASNYETIDDTLLNVAGLLESKSEHPLSKAIMKHIHDLHIELEDEITDFKAVFGNGLEAKLDGHIIRGGQKSFICKYAKIHGEILDKATKLANEGKTPLFFSQDERLLGFIAVADIIKDDSARAVSELKDMGIRVVMLTGDNEKTSESIGKSAGVDDIIAEVMPDEKEMVIEKISKYGTVAMIGDGINDVPALLRADTGIAIGTGADIAIEASDIILKNSSLLDVTKAIRISRAVIKSRHTNHLLALLVIIISICLGSGLFTNLLGFSCGLFAAIALSCVILLWGILNIFKLKALDVSNNSCDKPIKQKIRDIPLDEIRIDKEKRKLDNNIKVVKIDGMTCGHCEAKIKKSLEMICGVECAIVNHDDGTAVISLSKDVENETIKKAIEDGGYIVNEFK